MRIKNLILMAFAILLCSCSKEDVPSGVPSGVSGYLASIQDERYYSPYDMKYFKWKEGRVFQYSRQLHEWIYDSEEDSYIESVNRYTISEIQKDKKGRITSFLFSKSWPDSEPDRARFYFDYDRHGHLISLRAETLNYRFSNSDLRYVDGTSIVYRWEDDKLVEIVNGSTKTVFTYSDMANPNGQTSLILCSHMNLNTSPIEILPDFLFLSGMLGKGPYMLPDGFRYTDSHNNYVWTATLQYELNSDGTIAKEIITSPQYSKPATISYKYLY